MTREVTWLPNLVDGVVVWQLADDLNRPQMLGGCLLVPDVEGPKAMPTAISWHVADCIPLAEAEARFPEEVRAAKADFDRRVKALEAALATPGSAFARYKSAFALPPEDEPASWYYDPAAHALRVANWGAVRRREGAKSVPVHTSARFAKTKTEPGPVADRRDAPAGTAAANGRGARRAVVAIVTTVTFGSLLALGWCAKKPRPVVDAPVVVVPSASAPPPPPDRDHDGTDDANDECPDLPGTRRGCPEAGAGIVVTRDRISTDELVFFATGSAKLDPKAREVLERIAKLLVDTPSIAEVLVEGHADAVGDDARNEALSAARAKSARDVLVSHGVAEGRVRIASHGARERRVPVAGASAENRRVEIHITKVAP